MMGVAVYPQLANLLEERHLTVADLGRQIEERFGLSVNPKTLYRLTQSAPIQRADLEIAGATAAVLGVGLDDLFAVNTIAAEDTDDAEPPILGHADDQRMASLMMLQAQRLLTEREWSELEDLVAKYGRLLHERRVLARARRRGISIEQERRETEAQLARAVSEWQSSDIDAQQQALVECAPELPQR